MQENTRDSKAPSARCTRRRFLQRSAVAAAGAISGAPALANTASPNERLAIAVIGLTNRGLANLTAVASQAIVAICDVDEKAAENARRAMPKATFYTDYRRIFDRKDVDAVVVSTPDHSHAPPTMMALQAGKHVYCEKPLAHTVYEIRKVTEAAATSKCATQMGIQEHATTNYHRVVELVRADTIGRVREVHIWCKGAYAPGDRPKDAPPVPAGLHYDLWLGPAPYRPYNPAYLPREWRGWWDFGTGRLGDMGCHLFDLAHWALDLRHPRSVETEGPPPHPDSTPPWLIVRYEYVSRPNEPVVKLTWYDGKKLPPAIANTRFAKWSLGVLFVGEKGNLVADYKHYVLLPEERFADATRSASPFNSLLGHHNEWIKACKTGGKTSCGFEYSGPLAESVQLGTVAYRSSRRIEWDAAKLKITNAPEAMRYLRQEYRQGWHL